MPRQFWLSERPLVFPDNLPITAHLDKIQLALSTHQIIVVAGETGSGKTTQLPKLMLGMGRGISGQIGHTQPRRIAARSVAERLSQELNVSLGEQVGYQIRFNKKASDETYIKVITDGILLAELAADPHLKKYDTLIIDEAHERSLNIDFILGYLKWLLPKRPDLKIIITSATLDHQRFSNHFHKCPIIEVSGRGFPVTIHYQPQADDNKQTVDRQQMQGILTAIESFEDELGDILVFLSGEREIRESSEFLRKSSLTQSEILPLYSKLSSQEQQKIFSPTKGRRRIILATNIAETSLTIPNIRYVIDSGVARIKRYNARSKIQHLPIEAISKASANQRAGRCGRTAPGVCIRLYSQEDFQCRLEFTEPEILRSHLAHVILQMLHLGLGHAENFPWLDAPDSRYWKDAYQCLEELDAIFFDKTHHYKLTKTGRLMAQLSVDPRLAKFLISGVQKNCLAETLIIVSALSVADIFLHPFDKRQAADEKHRLFFNPHSDFVTLLNVWHVLQNKQTSLSNNGFKTFCDKHFLSYAKYKEWQDLYNELTRSTDEVFQHIKKTNITECIECTDYTPYKQLLPYASPKWIALHQSILSGLLSHVAQKQEKNSYLATRQRNLKLFPNSALAKKPPGWIMAMELIETKQIYARTAATIEPEWIEMLAPHLIKKNISNPHWDAKRGEVLAFEKVLFFGLTLIEKRQIRYAPIDPIVSHDIFLREALALRQLSSSVAFWQHNQQFLEELENLEERTRSRYFVPDDEWLYVFYESKIPQTIHSRTECEKWFQKADTSIQQTLFLKTTHLEAHPDQNIEQAYPTEFIWQDNQLKITYQFSPGSVEDGVTLTVPLALLPSLPGTVFDWLVPGLLEEKIHALLKNLCKEQRKVLMPLTESARLLRQQLSMQPKKDFYLQLAQTIAQHYKEEINPEQLKNSALPEFLRFNFHIVLEQKIIAQGRDLTLLKQQLLTSNTSVTSDTESMTYQHFPKQPLPTQEKIQQDKLILLQYPTLQAHGNGVRLITVDSLVVAKQIHHFGVSQLLQLSCVEPLTYAIKKLLASAIVAAGAKIPVTNKRAGLSKNQIWMRLERYLFSFETFCNYFCHALINMTFAEDFWQIRSCKQFEECYYAHQQDLITNAHMLVSIVQSIMGQLLHIPYNIENSDVYNLLYPGFLAQVPWEWLERYPFYLAAHIDGQSLLENEAFERLKQRYHLLLNKTCLRLHIPNQNELPIAFDPPLFFDPLLATSEDLLRGYYLLQELQMTLQLPQCKPIESVSVVRLNKLFDQLHSVFDII